MSKNTLLSELINYVSANSSGNVTVAAPASGVALTVNGTGRFTGQLSLGSTITNGTFTYTLPGATGTLALTSQIPSVTGFVPYSGATENVDLGVYSITPAMVYISGVGTGGGGVLNLKKDSTRTVGGSDAANTISVWADGTSLGFNDWTSGNTRSVKLSVASITNNTTVTLTIPNASGTLALTSNLSSYLPLAGGTLTGALSGTSASFSSTIATTGDITITKASAASFIANNTSASGKSFRLVSADDGTFRIQNTGVLDILTIASTGPATFSSSLTTGLSITSGDSVILSGELYWGGTTRARSYTTGASGSATLNYAFWNGSVWGIKSTLDSNGAATFSSSVTAGGQITMAYGGNPRLTLQDTDSGSGNVGILFKEGTNDRWTLASVGGAFQFFNESNASNALWITSTGNVGIGTTAPGARLAVVGPNAGTSINWTDNANNTGYLGQRLGAVTFLGSDGNLVFETAATERMRITSGGAVLIGTTSSTAITTGSSVNVGMQFSRFGVISSQSNADSNIYLSKATGFTSGDLTAHFVNGNYVGGISTNGSTTTYAVASDYRLKEDLKSIKGLEIVNKIKVYDYKWKTSEDRMDGVLAHELAEVLPYAVTGVKDGERMQAVDYSKIVPLLIQSIQEQQAQIEQLKQLINK